MDKKTRHDLYRYSVGPGWWNILDRYVPQYRALDPDCNFYIKEKYGVLRIYATGKLKQLNAFERVADAAELESETICECCGAPGRLRADLAWMLTLCDRCLEVDSEQRWRIEAETEQRWMESAAENI